MNGKDIFLGLRYVESAFLEEAEKGTFSAAAKKEGTFARRSVRRPMLIAAVIALSLLLVGCGVVYVMHLQDLAVGSKKTDVPIYDENGLYQGMEIMDQTVLTVSGLAGSPNYEAAQEWFDFMQEFDPQYEILVGLEGKKLQFPEKYDPYHVYDQKMADKIDEITEKFGLQLLGPAREHRSAKALLRYLGIDSVVAPGSGAEAEYQRSSYYEGGGLRLDFDLRMAEWPYLCPCTLCLTPKDRFDPALVSLDDTGDWKDWTYTTAAGDQVLILRSPSAMSAWIFCDRADTAVSLQVEAIHSDYQDHKLVSTAMTDQQLEQAADAINFRLTPNPGDPALLEENTADPSVLTQTQNGVTITVKKVETDGHTAYITLGVTAPEGTVLVGDRDSSSADFGNIMQDFFTPKSDRVRDGGFASVSLLDDGDGKDNTMDIQVVTRQYFTDGKPAFSPEEPWRLYIEDVKVMFVNPKIGDFDTFWKGEGNWQFDIPFDNGDFRELEFIKEPVTTKDGGGNDVVLTSLRLRTYSGILVTEGMTHPADLCDHQNQKYPYVVLEDGRQIRMGSTCQPDYEEPLPMDQVALVVLPDGTKLEPVR